MTPDDIVARVLYRDALMLVIDKPAGLPVHAGPRGGPNLEDFFGALRFGLPRLPALAHRLDRDTSGCLVLGRHRKALARLGKLFAQGRIEKTYWALVAGVPLTTQGRIALPLRRFDSRKGWRMAVAEENDGDAQPTVTDYRVLATTNNVSWLELWPRTGRTHQIRVHCAALGAPILGDPVYGSGADADFSLLLHARSVVVPLYPNRDPIAVTAPIPNHWQAALTRLGLKDETARLDPSAATATGA